jgi:hypothetical protein
MRIAATCVLAVLALAACAEPGGGRVQSFETPDAGIDALVDALRAGERDRLAQLLGPGAHELLHSGDPVADRRERDAFIAAYDALHALVIRGDRAVLEVGPTGWPLPIPLVRREGHWEFDAAGGAQELVRRRIGRNELGAIAVCIGIVVAQEDYAKQRGMYATKLRSDPGTRNGLYWQTEVDEPMSPAGPLLARAAAEGYGTDGAGPKSYRGYFYRALPADGPAVTGGAARPYVEKDVVRGYSLVAYPAQYGASGVMTFIVNQDGIIFQKDLGPATEKTAAALTAFNPDDSWRPLLL